MQTVSTQSCMGEGIHHSFMTPIARSRLAVLVTIFITMSYDFFIHLLTHFHFSALYLPISTEICNSGNYGEEINGYCSVSVIL